MRPRERDELAKHQKLEAINAQMAQHSRKMLVTLLLIVVLNVLLLALVIYQLLVHA